MPKKNDDYISVLGGCNMDIIGFPYKNFVPEDSNPAGLRLL